MKTKSNKLHIIITVCLAIAVVVLASVLALRGCGEQDNESSADVSVNTEVSETVSNNDVSTEVSEEISEEVSEEVSDPEVSVPEDHTHKYADTWKSNETDHWKECECGDKSDIASHTYGEWTTTKEATEDAAGSKKHTCTLCGHEETAIIPALSHTHKYADTWKSNETDHWKECNCGSKSEVSNHNYGEWTTTKEATEETDGSKYHTCNTCGYKETVVIPALEHTHKYADTWKSNETDHWKECNCGNKSEVSNHNYGEWTTTKEATEETEGNKYHTCKTCGYKETVTISALEHTHKYSDKWSNNETDHWKECKCGNKSNMASHNYGNWTTTKEVTEETEGSKYHTCKTCGYKETVTIPVLSHTHSFGNWKNNDTSHWKECRCGEKSEFASHTYGKWETIKEATCTSTGTRKHTCTVCGYSETETVPKANHTYSDWKNNATSHWKECKCGNKSNLSSHNFGSWTTTKEATEEAEGSRYHTCKTCGYKETETIPKVPHTHAYGDWKSNDTSHWKECKCGDKSQFASHTYGSWTVTKEATEEETGSRYHTCTVCGYKEAETIPVLEHVHSYGNWKNNETSHWKECRCGDKSQLSSHTYGEWETVTGATCTATGTKKHTCTACGYSETDTIPKTDHTYGDWKNDSTNHWKKCSKCGNVTSKANHTYDSVVTPPTDTEKGYTTHTCSECGYSYVDSYVVPVPSYSQGLRYRVNTDGSTCTIISIGDCTDAVLKIPPMIDEYKVTAVGDGAFYFCSQLTNIIIPDEVTTLGYLSFAGCLNINSVTIGNGVKTIDNYAFGGCIGLTSITIPDNVTTIGDSAFANCTSLKSVTISDSVTTISAGAFWRCYSLTSVTIPDSVTTIGNGAFKDCESLTSLTIPDSVTAIGSSAFSECTSLTSVTLGNSVTEIGDEAFFRTGLTSITIPDSVTTIGDSAFEGCASLTSATIPDSVTELGDGVFEGCNNLIDVTIGVGVTKLSYYAFQNCAKLQYNTYDNAHYLGNSDNPYILLVKAKDTSITSCTIHPNTKFVGDSAFSGCTVLTGITIPDSVTKIGSSAFYGCSGLTNVIIPDSVTTIGDSAFENCTILQYNTYKNDEYLGNSNNPYVVLVKTSSNSITSCTIHPDTKIIYSLAFKHCTKLTSVVIPNSVIYIGGSAFYGCDGLTSITVPDSVIAIGNSAFKDCESLTSVTIGNGVTTIDERAFSGCKSLTSITIPDSVTAIGYYAFYGCESLTSVTIPDSVTTIGDGAFCGCDSLTSVIIGNGVTTIGDSAFEYCTKLTSVTIGNSVTSIGDYAFYFCTSLTSITIPDSVTTIDFCAFYRCTGLTSVTIGDSVTTIGMNAFSGCTSLTSIAIGNSVTEIRGGAFENCTSLTSITIPDSVIEIDGAFDGCNNLVNVYYQGYLEEWIWRVLGSPCCNGANLYFNNVLATSITIPDGVVILHGSFSGCTSLTSITIPNSITEVAWGAFNKCVNLTDVYYAGSESDWKLIINSGNSGLTNATIHYNS